jgi:hypothetical protein
MRYATDILGVFIGFNASRFFLTTPSSSFAGVTSMDAPPGRFFLDLIGVAIVILHLGKIIHGMNFF